MENLQQCPFCGQNAICILKKRCLKNDFISYSIYHSACGCIIDNWQSQSVFDTEEQAVSSWNRRCDKVKD